MPYRRPWKYCGLQTTVPSGTSQFRRREPYFAAGPYFKGRLIYLGLTVVIDTGEAVVSITSNQSTAVDDDCVKQLGLLDYCHVPKDTTHPFSTGSVPPL